MVVKEHRRSILLVGESFANYFLDLDLMWRFLDMLGKQDQRHAPNNVSLEGRQI